ncbi:unnamed protein product [Sphagnum troendelagicum]
MLRCLRSTLSLEVEEISLQVCGRCCYVPTSVRDPRVVLCGNVEAWCSDSGMRKCAWGSTLFIGARKLAAVAYEI